MVSVVARTHLISININKHPIGKVAKERMGVWNAGVRFVIGLLERLEACRNYHIESPGIFGILGSNVVLIIVAGKIRRHRSETRSH